MELILDIGNSNIVMAIYHQQRLIVKKRLLTLKRRGVDFYRSMIKGTLLALDIDETQLQGIAIASVVPELAGTLKQALQSFGPKKVLVIDWKTPSGLKFRVDAPEKVGIDRIVNAAEAYHRFGQATIAIDMGTATTFDVVNGQGEFLGGMILPGAKTAQNALALNASQLFAIKAQKPKHLIGKNTEACLQSGFYYGQVAMIQGLIKRLDEQLAQTEKQPAKVVMTGGLSALFAQDLPEVDHFIEDLTLDGIHRIFAMNCKG